MQTWFKKLAFNIVPVIGTFYPKKLEFPVIYYHDIVEDKGFSLQQTNYHVFKKQMEYLARNNYKTLLFSEVEEFMKSTNVIKDKYVLITFDDGYRSNYLHAFSIMKDLNLKFNIFINTKMIEENDSNYMTIDMVKEMYNSGIVEFGSHTHSHIDSKSVTEDQLIKEINLCNEKIFDWLGYNTNDFCYPYGFYTKETNELLSKYYSRIYTSDCKPLERKEDAIIRGRIGISTDDSIADFKNKLSGKYDVMYLYYRKKNSN